MGNAMSFKALGILPQQFSQLDVYNSSNFRANVAVTNVTREGFKVSFYTWCDTRIAGASANWMAVAR